MRLRPREKGASCAEGQMGWEQPHGCRLQTLGPLQRAWGASQDPLAGPGALCSSSFLHCQAVRSPASPDWELPVGSGCPTHTGPDRSPWGGRRVGSLGPTTWGWGSADEEEGGQDKEIEAEDFLEGILS